VRNVTRPDAINSEFTSGTESAIGGSSKLMSAMQSGGTAPAGTKPPVDVNNAGTEATP
jgi:hypothetical protein